LYYVFLRIIDVFAVSMQPLFDNHAYKSNPDVPCNCRKSCGT